MKKLIAIIGLILLSLGGYSQALHPKGVQISKTGDTITNAKVYGDTLKITVGDKNYKSYALPRATFADPIHANGGIQIGGNGDTIVQIKRNGNIVYLLTTDSLTKYFNISPYQKSKDEVYNYDLDTNYQKIYAKFDRKPPLDVVLKQNEVVERLKDAGIWDKLDRFWMFATNDTINAKWDWITLDYCSFEIDTLMDDISYVNNADFMPYVGIAGTGAGYVNLRYAPYSDRIHLDSINATYGAYFAYEDLKGTTVFGIRHYDGSSYRYVNLAQSNDTTIHIQVHNTIGVDINTDNDIRNVTMTRVNNTYSLYGDGILLGNSSRNPTSLPDVNLYMFGNHNEPIYHNEYIEHSKTFNYCMEAYIGAALTADEVSTLNSILKDYNDWIENYYPTIYERLPTPSISKIKYFINQEGLETCNGKIYFMGGAYGGGMSYIPNWEYDPETNIWTEKTPVPDDPSTTNDTELQSPILREVNGKLYLIGGLGRNSYKSDRVYEYNPNTDTWDTAKARIPIGGVEDMGSAVVGNKIYCMGGNSPNNYLYVYDTETDTWDTTLAKMPEPKLLGDFGCAYNRKLYAISAHNTMTGYDYVPPVTSCYSYDIATDTWDTIAPIPYASAYKECEVINGEIWVIGGQHGVPLNDLAGRSKRIYIYNIANNEWRRGPDLPYGAQGMSSCYLNGYIYFLGGNDRYDFWRMKIIR